MNKITEINDVPKEFSRSIPFKKEDVKQLFLCVSPKILAKASELTNI